MHARERIGKSSTISSTSASQLPLTHIILSFNGFKILITSFGLYDKGKSFLGPCGKISPSNNNLSNDSFFKTFFNSFKNE